MCCILLLLEFLFSEQNYKSSPLALSLVIVNLNHPAGFVYCFHIGDPKAYVLML